MPERYLVRSAAGAASTAAVRLSPRTGARQALVGLAIGIVISLIVTRAMTSMLQDVTSTDPWTFAAVIVVTGLVAIIASVGPARRAGRADPSRVLGHPKRAEGGRAGGLARLD